MIHCGARDSRSRRSRGFAKRLEPRLGPHCTNNGRFLRKAESSNGSGGASTPASSSVTEQLSLDCAFKTGQANDYSVVAVVGEAKDGYYLRHVSRGRWEFPELKRQSVALAEIWKPHAVLIEDAASGQSLIQALKAETRLPILPVKPMGDKQSRAHAVSPLVESGRVFVPSEAPWLADFLDEATSFPSSAHDDQIDAIAQALSYLRGKGGHEYAFIPVPRNGATLYVGAGELKQQRLDAIEDGRAKYSRERLGPDMGDGRASEPQGAPHYDRAGDLSRVRDRTGPRSRICVLCRGVSGTIAQIEEDQARMVFARKIQEGTQ